MEPSLFAFASLVASLNVAVAALPSPKPTAPAPVAVAVKDTLTLLTGKWLAQCSVKKDDNFGIPSSFEVKATIRANAKDASGKITSLTFVRTPQTDSTLTADAAQNLGQVLSYFIDGISPFTLNNLEVVAYSKLQLAGHAQALDGTLMTKMTVTSTSLTFDHTNVVGQFGDVSYTTHETVEPLDENTFKTSSDTIQENMTETPETQETQINCNYRRVHGI